jgi:hypothetical protein
MRGYILDPVQESMTIYDEQQPTPTMTQGATATGNNMQDNTQFAISPGSVYWLFLMVLMYIAWGYWQNNQSPKEGLKYEDIKFNLHNIVGITLATTIGVNMVNVLLTKLSAMRIPVISKTAGTFLPLFHL